MASDYRAKRERVLLSALTTREKMILICLVEFLPNMAPSRERLGVMASVSARHVSRVLADLETMGVLVIDRAFGKRSSYTFTAEWETRLPVTGGIRCQEGSGDTTSIHQGHPVTGSGDTMSHKAVNEADKKADKDIPARTSKAPRKGPTLLPSDWKPRPDDVAFMEREGIEVETELLKFRRWGARNKRTRWDSVFTNWLNNALSNKRHQQNQGARRGRAPAPQGGLYTGFREGAE